ncbi:MAG: hypothetical protein IJ056_05155, partial [Acidaminococcaceae bacterium]|nr:hypothetical protein [Acidaminococcaceae bacterium]
TVKTETGDITADSVSAGNDALLTTVEGNVDAKEVSADHNATIATEKGNIAENSVTAGNDATLTAKTGDITAGSVNAGNEALITTVEGNVDAKEVSADYNATIATEKGDITTDSVTAGNNIHVENGNGTTKAGTLTAGNKVTVKNGDGQIIIGTADGANVSLTNAGQNGTVKADRVLAETRGNSNGTGAADVLLGGSSVSVKSVVNKGGSSPLAISTVGASADQAMKDIRLGQQNADGSYSGGISSASGAVIQQVWTDTGLIYAEGDTDLHISKAVANDKLHVANDEVSVAVYGRTPTHDGETIVYWTNNSRNKPNENMQAWFNRDYYGAGRWLWIDLKGNGAVTMHNGEMIDYNYYRKLYGDYPSLTDMMRKRLDIEISDNEMVYYDRLGLIRYDAPSVQNAKGDEIETD